MSVELPQIGTVFAARYDLTQILGQGGAGRVYEAVDRFDGRRVAVKISTSEDDGDRRRFAREARLLAKLRHPHIVELLDHGRQNELLYAVFELVPGRDLAALLDEGRTFDEVTTRRVLAQLLSALDEAHRSGLVHRDIKPENIRGGWGHDDPDVTLIDFGLARTAGPRGPDPITRTDELVGTPRYMSPEQLRGDTIGPASDLYSLGLVTFEMLAGRSHMHGGALLHQLDRLHTDHLFALPADVETSELLAHVIARLTATEIGDRFPSAAAALSALFTEENTTHVFAADHRRTPTPTRPSRAANALGVGALGFVGTIALGVLFMNPMRNESVAPTTPRPPPAIVAGEATQAAEPKAPVAIKDSPDLSNRAAVEAQSSVPSDGCGRSQPSGHGRLAPIQLNRKPTIVYIPAGYDPNRRYPLVMLFHSDASGGAEHVATRLRMDRLADEVSFVVVAPRGGSQVSWKNTGDVDSAHRDLEVALNSLCIDRTRIYAVGHGNGGRAVHWFACDHPELAGIATTAWVRRADIARCSTFPSVPRIHFATMKNKYTPPDGGTSGLGCAGFFEKVPLREFEKDLRQINGCREKTRRTWREADATCREWRCKTPLTTCRVDAGGLWPLEPPRGVFSGCDGPESEIDYGPEIWRFFEATGPRDGRAATP